MSRYVTCPDCDGSGAVEGDEPCDPRSTYAEECSTCNGRGELLEAYAPPRSTPRINSGD